MIEEKLRAQPRNSECLGEQHKSAASRRKLAIDPKPELQASEQIIPQRTDNEQFEMKQSLVVRFLQSQLRFSR